MLIYNLFNLYYGVKNRIIHELQKLNKFLWENDDRYGYELYPINRSITGQGVRDTLDLMKKKIL